MTSHADSVDTSAADAASAGVEPEPAEAADVFGSGLSRAQDYAASLAGEATVRGLVGPREGSKVWSRHLLSCAVLSSLVSAGETVADVGSGAGLPGIPLALAAGPDVTVTLVESLARRVRYLELVVDELDLDGAVHVLHARAEDVTGRFDAVVSRAVAPLPALVGLCRPLVRPGGRILAMRGVSAGEEIAALSGRDLRGTRGAELLTLNVPGVAEPTRVVRVSL